MTASPIAVSRKDVAGIVAATFPEYTGRKFRIVAADKISVYDLNWSGGTRCQYRACTIYGQQLGGLDKYNAMAPWANPAEGASLPLAPGACVVRHGIFCGKDTGLCIYVPATDIVTRTNPTAEARRYAAEHGRSGIFYDDGDFREFWRDTDGRVHTRLHREARIA